MKQFLTAFAFLFLSSFVSNAQAYKNNLETLDVQHYKLTIKVDEFSDTIIARTDISIKFNKPVTLFNLDFVTANNNGKGMIVSTVLQGKDSIEFSHKNNALTLRPKHIFPGIVYTFSVVYKGVPEDGLIISKNKFDDKTFFGDNWPNRAHNWFPCIDHPSDKATVEYLLTVPSKFQTIANGKLVEQSYVNDDETFYHWKTSVVIPTKVMVIGIAKFAVNYLDNVQGTPLSIWVYPQLKKEGFYDISVASKVLDYFITKMGSYPYEKLANVQSKTRFGGMENASAIFYSEASVTGNQAHEDLIAHEIAHQWFGNTASEIDWPHIWLSEGFATYLTDLYLLDTYGEEKFSARIQTEKEQVIAFSKEYFVPVIDFTTNYMQLINPNSYKKGAWILHMLRNMIGDEAFWKILTTYYEKFKFKNASSNDFKKVVEEITQKDFDAFFKQWLTYPGHPIFKSNWIYHNKIVRLIIEQQQDHIFYFPLEVEVMYTDGTSEIKKITVEHKASPYEIEVEKEVKELIFDPNNVLLFELTN